MPRDQSNGDTTDLGWKHLRGSQALSGVLGEGRATEGKTIRRQVGLNGATRPQSSCNLNTICGECRL